MDDLCGSDIIESPSVSGSVAQDCLWRITMKYTFGVFHQFSAFFIVFRGARENFRDLSQKLFGQVMQIGCGCAFSYFQSSRHQINNVFISSHTQGSERHG